MAMRAKYDQAEQNMDEDLRTATDKLESAHHSRIPTIY